MTDTVLEPTVATMPRIGDPAPEFTAETTQGQISFPGDYAGKWVILFSHPADFTPVCTTEFMTFASMQDEFRAYNTELVGLSVDGLYSHIAWLRTIKDKMVFRDMEDVEVTFPLIDDVSMSVATKYGMIMPGEDSTKAVRAVFVVDPKGIIRTIVYYPLSLGRNFDELLRVVKGLQTADAFDVARVTRVDTWASRFWASSRRFTRFSISSLRSAARGSFLPTNIRAVDAPPR